MNWLTNLSLPFRWPWDVGPIFCSSGQALPKKSFYPIVWLLPIIHHLGQKLHSFILHFRFHHSTMQAKSWCRNLWSRQVHKHVGSLSFWLEIYFVVKFASKQGPGIRFMQGYMYIVKQFSFLFQKYETKKTKVLSKTCQNFMNLFFV